MDKIAAFRTFDGVIHTAQLGAKHHVEAIYGDKLSRLASKMVLAGNHTKMMEAIDALLPQFTELLKIREDLLVSDLEE